MPGARSAGSSHKLLSQARVGFIPDRRDHWRTARGALAMSALAVVTLREGWRDPVIAHGAARALEALLLGGVLATWLAAAKFDFGAGLRRVWATAPQRIEAALALLGLLATLTPRVFAEDFFPVQEVAIVLLAGLHGAEGFIGLARRRLSPGLIFVGSFGALILLGTGALMLPAATPEAKPIGLLDALFTSTSAVCVTGLIVRDTASEFTRFGQSVILALIQLGGLGIVFFGALLAVAMGSSLGVRAMQATGHAGEQGISGEGVRRLLIFIGGATLVVEAVGAGAFYFGWPGAWAGAPAMESGADRAFHSVFFSVSGFCNAGFATSPNSLQGLRFHWTSLIVMTALITLGGLGFPTLNEVRRAIMRRLRRLARRERRTPQRMNLHARLVLTMSLGLYLAGVVGIAIGRMAQDDAPPMEALADAHFMSVTARTAGFDTIAPGGMDGFSRFVLMFLMFIGGSPGSTAGGVKTIVVAVLLVSVWATIRGREQAEAFHRSIPDDLVKRAGALMVMGLATITAIASLLIAFEGHKFDVDDLLFEAVSACGTVGLSTGVTPDLGPGGKIAVIAGMFLGRVGPLAALAALLSVARRKRPRYSYPTEPVQMS